MPILSSCLWGVFWFRARGTMSWSAVLERRTPFPLQKQVILGYLEFANLFAQKHTQNKGWNRMHHHILSEPTVYKLNEWFLGYIHRVHTWSSQGTTSIGPSGHSVCMSSLLLRLRNGYVHGWSDGFYHKAHLWLSNFTWNEDLILVPVTVSGDRCSK